MTNSNETRPTLEAAKDIEDESMIEEIAREFGEFCSESRIWAKGGCCRFIYTMDEFFQEPENMESDDEN